jgi:hypothetical protein
MTPEGMEFDFNSTDPVMFMFNPFVNWSDGNGERLGHRKGQFVRVEMMESASPIVVTVTTSDLPALIGI